MCSLTRSLTSPIIACLFCQYCDLKQDLYMSGFNNPEVPLDAGNSRPRDWDLFSDLFLSDHIILCSYEFDTEAVSGPSSLGVPTASVGTMWDNFVRPGLNISSPLFSFSISLYFFFFPSLGAPGPIFRRLTRSPSSSFV